MLRFSRTDQEILAGFGALVDRLVGSFADFCRPEFCKIEELPSGKRAPAGKSQTQGRPEGSAAGKSEPGWGAAEPHGQDAASYSCAVPQDFETLLYSGAEGGPEAYSSFIGRLQTKEAARGAQEARKEYVRGASHQAALGGADPHPVYIGRHLRVAQPSEECYRRAKQEILAVVAAHLADTKRVLEIYQQFEPVLQGSLALKVSRTLAAVQEDGLTGRAADKEYAGIIKEVRLYQKLSRQLPTIVFLPMFEVGVRSVKEEIQRRLAGLLERAFEHYEAGAIAAGRALCTRYEAVCERLGASLTSPAEVVQMESYKAEVLGEMARVQQEAQAHRDSVFFLLRADRQLRQESQDLVLKLHAWPQKLDAHLQGCEEKHEAERAALEAQLARLRADFDRDTAQLEASLREVAQWGDPQACWQNIEKITQYQRELSVQEERMAALLAQEKMLHGSAGKPVGFEELRAWFAPYYDLWTGVHGVLAKKRLWVDCALAAIDPVEVDGMVTSCTRTIRRL